MNLLRKKLLVPYAQSLVYESMFHFARNVKPNIFIKPSKSEDINTSSTPNTSSDILKKVESSMKNQEKVIKPSTVIGKEDDASDHAVLNTRILTTASLDELNSFYLENKGGFNPINLCTCLTRVVHFANLQKKPVKNFRDHPMVQEIIPILKERFDELNEFGITNLVSNLTKFDLVDEDLIRKAVNKCVEKKVRFNEKALAYLTWTLAKLKIKHEGFLDHVAKEIEDAKKPIQPKSLANIFWGMSQLEYSNQHIKDLMEQYILKEYKRFDMTDITLAFAGYAAYRIRNLDILDHLAALTIQNISKMSFRNISNLAHYCSTLDYKNHLLFNHIEAESVRRLKNTKEFKNLLKRDEKDPNLPEIARAEIIKRKDKTGKEEKKEEKTTEISTEVINDLDISQLLVAFCKLKIVKSELFELLEMKFVSNISSANPNSIVSYAFAHSALCLDMLERYQTNKDQYLRRSVNNLKKFHNLFYEMVLPTTLHKLKDFSFEQVYSLLISGSRPIVTKRVLRRGLLKLGIEALPKLEAMKSAYPLIEYEKTLYRFNQLLKKYAMKDEHLLLIQLGYDKIGVNIALLDKAYGQILLEPDDNKSYQFEEEEDEAFFEDEASGQEKKKLEDRSEKPKEKKKYQKEPFFDLTKEE